MYWLNLIWWLSVIMVEPTYPVKDRSEFIGSLALNATYCTCRLVTGANLWISGSAEKSSTARIQTTSYPRVHNSDTASPGKFSSAFQLAVTLWMGTGQFVPQWGNNLPMREESKNHFFKCIQWEYKVFSHAYFQTLKLRRHRTFRDFREICSRKQIDYVIEGVAAQAECPFMLHDCRRTFLTLAERLSLPYVVLKKLANHSVRNDTTFGCIAVDVERLREPMQMITNEFLRLCNKEGQEQESTSQ